MQTGLLAREGEPKGMGDAQGQPMPADAPQEGGGQEATPEEQAQYNAFVETGLKLMTDDRFEDSILGSLKASKDPVLSLASTALTVVMRVEDAAKQKGQTVPDEIVEHGGLELMEALAEMADAAKIHNYTSEEITQAYWRAVDMYREEKQARGEVNQDAAKQELEAMKQADQSGQLPPELVEAAKAMGG